MKRLALVLLLLAATGVGVCAADTNQPQTAATGAATGPGAAGARAPASWTFMVYLDADNNLEGYGIEDFLQMADAGSDANVKIVVLMDRGGNDSSYDGWTTARYGLVNAGDTPTATWGATWSPAEPNMGSGATLTAFINRVTTDYPATNYALVLWDHGGGWRARAPGGVVKAVCWDDTSGGDCLYTKEVQEAIDAATVNLTLVSFDACLMGMLEVAYQLRNTGASVMVASEETIPGTGWPYDTVLSALKANPSWSAAQFGTAIVDRYYASYSNDQTLAAINLTQVGDLATLISTFGDTLRTNWNSNLAACATAAEAVKTKLDGGMIIHEHHGTAYAGSHGLAIYLPDGAPDSAYSAGNIAFAADHTWDAFLTAYHNTMQGSWVATARGNATGYTDPDFRDLYDFADHVASSGGLNHFAWATIASPRHEDEPFAVTITAKDGANGTYTGFGGTASLSGVVPAVTIGGGGSAWDFPLQVFYEQARTQVIYLHHELGGAQTFGGLALNVATLPGKALGNWTIRMKHTALSSFDTASWEGPATGWTTVYQADDTVAITGWVYFAFATPFSYDGSSNLMLDFSFNNSGYGGNGEVYYSAPGGYRAVTGYSDSMDGDPLNWSGTMVPSFYDYPVRSTAVPNLKLLRRVSITPTTTTGNFTAGIWIGDVTVAEAPLTGMYLQVRDASGHVGNSNAFDVSANPPEIVVAGNALEIPDGDTTPDAGDGTQFGTVVIGESASHDFTITNTAGGRLTLNLPLTVSGSSFHVLTQPASASLAGGASTTFSIQFAPAGAAGARTGTVTIHNNDPDEGTYTFAVAGTADTDPEIAVYYGTTEIPAGDATPSVAEGTDFGTGYVGSNYDHTFTVGNAGTETLTLGAVSILGDAQFTVVAQPTSPVAPGGCTTFTLRLASATVGYYAATVTLDNNDANENPFTFALTGAVMDEPALEVTYGAVPVCAGDNTPGIAEGTDFGGVLITGRTQPRVFTLTNVGSQPLTITGATMSGVNAAEFTPTLGAISLAPAASTTLTVVFDPAALGARTATASIASDDPDGNYNFALQGSGKKKSSAVAGGGGGGGGCVLVGAAEAGAVLGLWPWLVLLLGLGWRRRR